MAESIVGLIGGSGLGQALLGEIQGEPREVETPFGRPSGPILLGRFDGVEVAFLLRHGDGHTIPPTAVPYRANIYALKSLGVTRIIAGGATGSLREEIRPRDLVVVDQVIDKTHRRAGSFFDQAGIAAHIELADPFCPAIRKTLLAAAGSVDTTVHDGGTYICMEGPAFSTMAESRMHRAWGGDLIGMTCMPEARLAREAEMCYALLALPTDYDCWRPHEPGLDKQTLLKEIIGHLEAATANSVTLIKAALRAMAGTADDDCPCRHALQLAIWSDRKRIPTDTIERLGVLVARYFDR